MEGRGREEGWSTAAVVAEIGVGGYAGHGVVVGVDHGRLVWKVVVRELEGCFDGELLVVV